MKGRPFALDHLMVQVPDSEQAGLVFEALGFAVTPRSTMPGLSNRLVCFPPDDPRGASFIELISIDAPDLAPEPVIDLLGPRHGPAAIVVATDDAAGLAQELSSRPGILPARDFSRSWDVAGRRLDLSFSVLIARRGSAPLGWSAIQHRTPEHYRVPEFLTHAAGRVRMQAILAVATDPRRVADEMSALWGCTTLLDGSGSARVALGGCELRIEPVSERRSANESGATCEIVGVSLGTSDPDAAADRMASAAGSSASPEGRGIRIRADGWDFLIALEPYGRAAN